jgi:hypothetical protein
LSRFAHGRQAQLVKSEPRVQIAPESAFLDESGQVAIGGGYDPNVDAIGFDAANAPQLAFLQHAQ